AQAAGHGDERHDLRLETAQLEGELNRLEDPAPEAHRHRSAAARVLIGLLDQGGDADLLHVEEVRLGRVEVVDEQGHCVYFIDSGHYCSPIALLIAMTLVG